MTIDSTRIAKNTLFLYARLILVMGVTLYSSRVILEVLGATDYGLYYAVFSVIGILSFLNGTLSGGTSRFITFELGRGNPEKLALTFSTTWIAHLLLAGFVLILGETVGLWYAKHILVVPEGRLGAALVVYQLSIITTILTIIGVPFNAEILAHERMNIYAYIGIYQAIAKLLVVYLILNFGFDKLVFFAWLQAGVSVSVALINIWYGYTRFQEVSLRFRFAKSIIKSILKFSGWNIIANLSETLMSQGIIMLYNIFFLPVVVTAQAIANQIANALAQLVDNVRQAVNPQVIKLYANNQHLDSQKLTFLSAEYIFYLLLLFGVPCIMVMPTLLNLWLVKVPEYTVAFARLIIAQQIIGNFSSAFYTPMLAANKMAKNSISSIFLCVMQFGVLWILFHFGFGPLWARYLGILSALAFSVIVKPYILHHDIKYNLNDIYLCIGKCFIVLICVALTNIFIYLLIDIDSILSAIFVGCISFISVGIIEYLFIGEKARRKLLTVVCKRIKFLKNIK